jgi:serine/threonine-protein kinase HipA
VTHFALLNTPGSGFNGFHTTTINNNGDPSIDDILAVGIKSGLNRQRMNEIIEDISSVIYK